MKNRILNFQKLTPKDDVDINIYKEALDYIFKNPDIKNVGITGAYCAGKSSVIESYKKANQKKKFIHISLAYFNQVKDKKITSNSDSSNELEENVLEGKILNQLIHQIDSKKIPQTNFRVKHKANFWKSFLISLCFMIFVINLTYLFSFNTWKKYLSELPNIRIKNIFLWSINPEWMITSGLIVFFLCGIFIYYIIHLQRNKNLFRKISIQGNEIEIFEQSENSYFDKYLNEVLYLFYNADADVIAFEDMDRYNTNQIFQRLREVNTLVNNQRKKENQKIIRFFYLLRDDIFVNKERTKFFDYILPIVPIVDSSNSYDQFIEHFSEGKIFDLFDEHFLQGIALYIDDMRILKNIYNEFIIYNNRIGIVEQDANKLLSIIVYKNIFPRDFSDLQLGKGFVYSLFEEKMVIIAKEKSKLQLEVTKLENLLSSINDETLESEQEINLVYSHPPKSTAQGKTAEQYRKDRDKRIKNITMRSDNTIKRTNEKIIWLNKKINFLQNNNLSELITRENIDSIFKIIYTNEIGIQNEFKELKSSKYFPLLKYLLRNGYIDETYPDYMTYFYENSISRTDKIFLRSVTDQNPKDYSYPLNQPEKIVRHLRNIDFENEETLNLDLLDFLLDAQLEYSEQLRHMFIQLGKRENFHFLSKYFYARQKVANFVRYANNQRPDLIKNILNSNIFSSQQKKSYILESIYNSPDEDILVLNSENILFDYIINQSDFLDIEEPQIAQIIHIFEILNIQFIYIEYSVSNLELWNEVYSHNFYELNWQMINSILVNQYKVIENSDFSHKNLSLIFSQASEPLAKYIDVNISDYFDIVLDHCNSQITDDEKTISYILNHKNIDLEQKENYLKYLQKQIHILEKIEDQSLWENLIENNHIIYNEKNVLTYYFAMGNSFDQILIQFINTYGDSFDYKYDQIVSLYGKDGGSNFYSSVVKCNELKNEKYSAILNSLNRFYRAFLFDDINEDKIDILIKLNIIRMSPKTLDFMREHYPNNIQHFITRNIQQYVEEVITEINFLISETLPLLTSNIKLRYKTRLLRNTSEPISIVDKEYSANIQTYILKNNFDQNDLQYLLDNYDELSIGSQNAIQEITLSTIDNIVNIGYSIAFSLLHKLLKYPDITYSQKNTMFSFSVGKFNHIECIACLDILELENFKSLLINRRPTFENTPINLRILEAFQKNKWITSYRRIDANTYQAYGKNIMNKKIPKKRF